VSRLATGAITASGRINSKGYVLPEEDDMHRCTGCNLCETVCPDFAITIETEDGEGD
jgi:formate hydrogenlyase subunit 6/NADH:ubiquinone oxidoreductase subunit I